MRINFILLGFLFSIVSCSTKKKVFFSEPKIAKTVPLNFVNSMDSGFSNHQDTVYYDEKYFTGYRYTQYKNGDTAMLQSFFNGLEEGDQQKWYPNKQIAVKRFYINGRKEGIHQGWWPDGKQKFYFETYNDEYNGIFKEWYSSGLLTKEFHYQNGIEEGSQRLWWDNGSVRANYVKRNGKKYGLIGLKTCINPGNWVIDKQKNILNNKK